MKFDRDRFLFLVPALAAGCAVYPPAMPEPATARSDAPERPATDVPETPPAPPTASEDAPNPYDESASDEPKREISKIVGQTCSASLNARGHTRSCSLLRAPTPTCFDEGGDAALKQDCEHIRERFKPRVADRAVECLLARSGTRDLCAEDLPSTCVYQGLALTCLEPAAKSSCKPVLDKCKSEPDNKLSQESCEAAFSAMREAERPKFLSCATESCDLAPCVR